MEKGKHGAEIWRYLGFTPRIKAAALRKPDLAIAAADMLGAGPVLGLRCQCGFHTRLVWISRKGKEELIVNGSMRSAHNATNSFYPWHRPSGKQ